MKRRSNFEEEANIPKSCSPIDLPEYQYEAMNYVRPRKTKLYVSISLCMIVFGIVLFAYGYMAVPYQDDVHDILSTMLVGMMGFVLVAMGIFGLWETWRKQL